MQTARLKIQGRVQGVFYRQSTRDRARSLGLTGWVRNAYDGSVEAEVSGDKAIVEQLIEWCRTGPPAARVDTVDVEWVEELQIHVAAGRFEIR